MFKNCMFCKPYIGYITYFALWFTNMLFLLCQFQLKHTYQTTEDACSLSRWWSLLWWRRSRTCTIGAMCNSRGGVWLCLQNAHTGTNSVGCLLWNESKRNRDANMCESYSSFMFLQRAIKARPHVLQGVGLVRAPIRHKAARSMSALERLSCLVRISWGMCWLSDQTSVVYRQRWKQTIAHHNYLPRTEMEKAGTITKIRHGLNWGAKVA